MLLTNIAIISEIKSNYQNYGLNKTMHYIFFIFSNNEGGLIIIMQNY